ncbi:hypothetical protein [Nostoc sp. TCL240-02]|uniref:hypothetical protein n=1 Tax=Nostoc sp. TCL240-02 TaxID=2572090 RepID=UPI00157F8587|nr:hypothetical protein [Nostoc sp. TCL240-02]QKQ77483.1 hypothetical protein FBB35_33050 [Nostoc sp. TCL240-02]
MLLIVISALTILPAPAMADIAIIKCEQDSDCGNLAAFAAGVASGSVVTLMATGHTAVLAGAGAAVGSAVAAPVLLPVAATAAVGYVGYGAWKALNHSESNP